MYTHTHTEGALTTTASTPVMTVPDEAIPNTVVVEINGFTPSTVTIYNYVTPQFNGDSIYPSSSLLRIRGASEKPQQMLSMVTVRTMSVWYHTLRLGEGELIDSYDS